MKKTYMRPLAQVAEVETESLICLSIQEGKADGSAALGKDRTAPINPENAPAQPSYGNLW